METKQFEIGKTYYTRAICNSEVVYSYKVIGRSKKRLTMINDSMDMVNRGIYIYDGSECCKPDGIYSMCPIIRADKEIY